MTTPQYLALCGSNVLIAITYLWLLACAYYGGKNVLQAIVRAVRRILWRKRTQRQKALLFEVERHVRTAEARRVGGGMR